METYDKKLNRRLKTRTNFPLALQQVPIRYVDEISALTDRQQELLMEALGNGKSVRQTLPKLQNLGDEATIELLTKADPASTSQTSQVDAEDIEVLTNILGDCFPGVPSVSTVALAESPVMAEAQQIVKALRLAMESQNFSSDFVVVSLYAVIKYVKKTIEDKIQSNPAFLQTVLSSGLVWEGDNT